LYRLLILVSRLLIFLFVRLEIQGISNVPGKGALIVVSNHLSVSDPVLLGAILGRRIFFLAKEDLFRNRWAAYFVRSFGSIPGLRGHLNRAALRSAGGILKSGGVIGMFPEGRRSPDHVLNHASPGTALLACYNDVPILPVGISGSERIKGFFWIFSRPGVVIRIGPPFRLQNKQTISKENLKALTVAIMEKICNLIPLQYCGVYQSTEERNNGN